MNNDKKNIILIIAMFLIGIGVTGGTYAYWSWSSTTSKNVVFTTAGLSDYVVYNEGQSHFVGDFLQSTEYCDGISNTVYFYKTAGVDNNKIVATINMDVNRIESPISNSSNVHWTLTKINSDSNYLFEQRLEQNEIVDMSSFDCDFIKEHSSVVVNQNGQQMTGTFNGVVDGSTLVLANDLEVIKGDEEGELLINDVSIYTIWIWIDSEGTSSLSGKTLDTNIWTQFDLVDSEG